MNIEKLRTKQDLEMLKDKYSLEVVACQTNLQECNYKIENLKKEVLLVFDLSYHISIYFYLLSLN